MAAAKPAAESSPRLSPPGRIRQRRAAPASPLRESAKKRADRRGTGGTDRRSRSARRNPGQPVSARLASQQRKQRRRALSAPGREVKSPKPERETRSAQRGQRRKALCPGPCPPVLPTLSGARGPRLRNSAARRCGIFCAPLSAPGREVESPKPEREIRSAQRAQRRKALCPGPRPPVLPVRSDTRGSRLRNSAAPQNFLRTLSRPVRRKRSAFHAFLRSPPRRSFPRRAKSARALLCRPPAAYLWPACFLCRD